MQPIAKNCTFLNENKQILINKYMPSADDLQKLSAFFSALSDRTRIRIVSALSVAKSCVGDLSKALNINQTTLSHQLALLKREGIVQDERRGKSVFYKIKEAKILRILLWAVEIID